MRRMHYVVRTMDKVVGIPTVFDSHDPDYLDVIADTLVHKH